MKRILFACLAAAMSLSSQSVFSQTENDTTLLGLAGDNLSLFAVLDLFQQSKTIEDFEKALNEQKTGINNMDLDLDKKVDFIKVVTKQKDSSFTFVLQIAVSEKETQDVAVILLDKDKKGTVSMQIVGDKELYGENYVVEPKPYTPPVTPNPGYQGEDPIILTAPATTTTTVVVQSAPIVQYVYSPLYVPYVPPFYYGFYPPYFAAFSVMAVGIYHANHYHYHGHGGYGYHNTTVIRNENNFNNYNGDRNRSDRVSDNKANGRYGDGNRAGTRDGASAGNRASTTPSNRAGGGPSASTRPSTTPSTRQSGGASASTRPTTSNSSSGRSRSSGGYSGGGGGGYSGGGGGMRGGGGGGMRGGGGGGRRR